MRTLWPNLQSIPIKDITYRKLIEVISIVDWQSMKTRSNALIVLRGIFEVAYIDGLIEDNPALRIRNIKHQKPLPDPLTLVEAEKIIEFAVKQHGEQTANYFEFAIFTGMRPSEIIALQWGDIDFNNKLARVQRAKVLNTIKCTKTAQIRDIELNERACDILMRQKKYTYVGRDIIFINSNTNLPYANHKQQGILWNHILKILGIRNRPCYQARRTFATLNLMAGANPMWVAKQMGHSSMKMLLEKYSKWIDKEDQSRERKKLDDLMKMPPDCPKGLLKARKPLYIKG